MLKTYPALLEHLKHRGLFHIEPGLERVKAVLAALGNPQDRIPAVHIAGTNGKGSVAATLESVLRAAGHRTGFYLSPHLLDWLERFRIAGSPATPAVLVSAAQAVLQAEGRLGFHLTHFEFLTVTGFVLMAKADCDLLVLETGMGGTWDATNAIAKPLLSVITSIGLDHTQWLGTSEREIAQEKAGIIKPGAPIVSGVRGPGQSVIQRAARENGCVLRQLDRDFSVQGVSVDWKKRRQVLRYTDASSKPKPFVFGLLGEHQIDNAAVALATVQELRRVGWFISDAAIRHGLRSVQWPGRFDIRTQRGMAPIVLDGAHNPHALRRFLETLQESPFGHMPKTVIFSAYRDKEYKQMAAMLTPFASRVFLCALPGQRGVTLADLRKAFPEDRFPVHGARSPSDALHQSLKQTPPYGVIVGTGSLALVGMLLGAQNSLAESPRHRAGITHA